MKIPSSLLVAAPLASAAALSTRSLLPRAADGTVKPNAFNYTNEGGPLAWYGLNATANSECSTGSHQSPIDIVTNSIGYASNGSVILDIPNVYGARFENLGSGLEVVMPNGSLTANGTTFPLVQFHFHTPGEHRVNEEYFPMECHFVFQTKQGAVAVVGFLMELSPFGFTTPLFDSAFAHLDDITAPGTFTTTGYLDFTGVMRHFHNHGVYAYTGSLTTPPCSENVLWYISTQPLPVNVQQYNAVKKVLKFNSRYTQNALGQPNLLEVAAHEVSHDSINIVL